MSCHTRMRECTCHFCADSCSDAAALILQIPGPGTGVQPQSEPHLACGSGTQRAPGPGQGGFQRCRSPGALMAGLRDSRERWVTRRCWRVQAGRSRSQGTCLYHRHTPGKRALLALLASPCNGDSTVVALNKGQKSGSSIEWPESTDYYQCPRTVLAL